MPTLSHEKEIIIDLAPGVKLELVLIPAGEFQMGSPDSDEDDGDDELRPQHRVRITRPFYLGKYLVTQEQWGAVMGSNGISKSPSSHGLEGDLRPASSSVCAICLALVLRGPLGDPGIGFVVCVLIYHASPAVVFDYPVINTTLKTMLECLIERAPVLFGDLGYCPLLPVSYLDYYLCEHRISVC